MGPSLGFPIRRWVQARPFSEVRGNADSNVTESFGFLLRCGEVVRRCCNDAPSSTRGHDRGPAGVCTQLRQTVAGGAIAHE